MTHKHIEVRPLAGSLGAEICGVDLRDSLDDETFEEIHQALLDNLVIFLRNQDITPDQQKAFGRRFGELHIHPYIPTLEGHPEIIKLESADDGPGEMAYQSNTWHTDLTYTAEPPMGSMLHGIKVPAVGGDTMFLNLYASYQALSDTMKSLVDGLTAVHDIVASMPPDFTRQSWAPKQLARMQEATPPVEHPVVRTHPETKRKCLFVNRNFTSYIKGMTLPESDALLGFLLEHIEQPEFQCRFHWETKSLAFWDNRCTQHYAVNDYRSKRQMHRVTICGERPH
ncbi:MAG: TauD/TfdA family dioxygenase [Gammaproteobacteria bacterium]|jgi:taurine dioxygenase